MYILYSFWSCHDIHIGEVITGATSDMYYTYVELCIDLGRV